MDFSKNVSLVTVNVPDSFKVFGPETKVHVEVSAQVGGSRYIEKGVRSPDRIPGRRPIFAGYQKSFQLPVVEATGWFNAAGTAVTTWSYEIDVYATAPERTPVRWKGTITPTTTTAITLDPAAGAFTNDGALADTGLVTVPIATGSNFTTSDSITVQRYGKTVTLSVRNAANAGALAGNQLLLTLPAGFRPAVNLYQDSYAGTRTFLEPSGNLTFIAPAANEYYSITFLTQSAPPA